MALADTSIAFTTIDSDYLTGDSGNESLMVVQNQEGYDKLWNTVINADVSPGFPEPGVNFAQQTVLAFLDSWHPTGGYSVAFKSISIDSNGVLQVMVQKTQETTGGIAAAAMQPVQVVVIPRFTGDYVLHVSSLVK